MMHSFSYNSQIKRFRAHVDMNTFSCFGMWYSCPMFVRTFRLHVYEYVHMCICAYLLTVWNSISCVLYVMSQARLLQDCFAIRPWSEHVEVKDEMKPTLLKLAHVRLYYCQNFVSYWTTGWITEEPELSPRQVGKDKGIPATGHGGP
jgi:hypothetical protein